MVVYLIELVVPVERSLLTFDILLVTTQQQH